MIYNHYFDYIYSIAVGTIHDPIFSFETRRFGDIYSAGSPASPLNLLPYQYPIDWWWWLETRYSLLLIEKRFRLTKFSRFELIKRTQESKESAQIANEQQLSILAIQVHHCDVGNSRANPLIWSQRSPINSQTASSKSTTKLWNIKIPTIIIIHPLLLLCSFLLTFLAFSSSACLNYLVTFGSPLHLVGIQRPVLSSWKTSAIWTEPSIGLAGAPRLHLLIKLTQVENDNCCWQLLQVQAFCP